MTNQPSPQEIAENLATEYGQREDCDVLLLTGSLDATTCRAIRKQCADRRRRSNILLILVSWGGDPHATYRIGRCLQRCYKQVRVFVPEQCKSAGTLLAIAGHKLIIGDYGELGPIDVQQMRQDDLWEQASGLIEGTALTTLGQVSWNMFEKLVMEIKQMSFGRVTFKTAADAAAPIVSGVLSPIYAQIDPLKVGEVSRALEIAGRYAENLNVVSRNMQETAINELTARYPDHGFVIDREEAERLFQRVEKPEELLASLTNALSSQLNPVLPALVFLTDEPASEEHQDEPHPDAADAEPEARPGQPNGGVADAAENQANDREAAAAA